MAWHSIFQDIKVDMHTPLQDETLLDKWRESTAREKSEAIAAFLNEYGEQASWEDWLTFLHKCKAKGFEWTNSVD